MQRRDDRVVGARVVEAFGATIRGANSCLGWIAAAPGEFFGGEQRLRSK